MLGDIKKLNQLKAGMNQRQVRDLLGEPSETELKAGKTVLKYSLHRWLQGWKPVYVVFGDTQLLEEWYVNEAEFLERQKIWVAAWPLIDKNINK